MAKATAMASTTTVTRCAFIIGKVTLSRVFQGPQWSSLAAS